MRRLPSLLLTALLGASPTLLAQHAPSLRGAWKRVEIVINRGPDAGRHTTDVQPGLAIFTDTHYARLWVIGFAPRPEWSAEPTDEERGRVYEPFGANAGTYQLTDSILTMTPVVAKDPVVMAGNYTITFRVQVVADSMWFSTTSTDSVETRSKWVRIERLSGR